MSNRKRIKAKCTNNNIEITALDYVREYVAVPEEMVPVGWFLQASIFDSEGFEDCFEFYGTADDIISQLDNKIKELELND